MPTLSDLRASPLFKNLSDEELSKISQFTKIKEFPAKRLIIRQDDASDFFYVVLKGRVRVFRSLPNGAQIEIAELKEGSFFGEMALLDGSKRSANVETIQDSAFLMISREDFLNEIWEFPTVVAKLLKGMSTRIRKTDEKFIIELQEKNVELEGANQELKKIDEMKSKFFSLSSHELRTPLGVILMTLPLLEKFTAVKLSKKGKSVLDAMERQLLKLSDTIKSILKASESQESPLDDKKAEAQPNEIIRLALSDLNHFFELRKLKVTADLDPELPKILLDSQKFYQIVLNLIMNAIRFTPDGGSIKIRTKKQSETISLSVSDSGIGIDRKHFEDIFKPFYIVASEMKHSSGTYEFMSGGLGLGLTIAKKFVEYHRGKIELESPKNMGSTFTVTLSSIK